MRSGWRLITKRLQIIDSPAATYSVKQMEPLRISMGEKIESSFTPKASLPQFGDVQDYFQKHLATRDFGDVFEVCNSTAGPDAGGAESLPQDWPKRAGHVALLCAGNAMAERVGTILK